MPLKPTYGAYNEVVDEAAIHHQSIQESDTMAAYEVISFTLAAGKTFGEPQDRIHRDAVHLGRLRLGISFLDLLDDIIPGLDGNESATVERFCPSADNRRTDTISLGKLLARISFLQETLYFLNILVS